MKGVVAILIIALSVNLIGCQPLTGGEQKDHDIQLINDRIGEVPGRKIEPLNYELKAAYDTKAVLTFEIHSGSKLQISEAIEKDLVAGESALITFEMDATSGDQAVFQMGFSDTERNISYDNFIANAYASQGTIVNNQSGISQGPMVSFEYEVKNHQGQAESWLIHLGVQYK